MPSLIDRQPAALHTVKSRQHSAHSSQPCDARATVSVSVDRSAAAAMSLESPDNEKNFPGLYKQGSLSEPATGRHVTPRYFGVTLGGVHGHGHEVQSLS